MTMDRDAEVIPVGLGDEEVDDWPGNELPPAVLPDFDEVGFPRHQLLDLPSRVLLVLYRANGFIERRVAAYAKPSHAFANS